jgi:Photosynthetic reaction centre cytochrome C subunit
VGLFMKSLRLVRIAAVALMWQGAPQFVAAQSNGYEFYRTRVEPIFAKKRAGHGRCIVCHATGGAPGGFGLQPLASGSTTWTEEQSRRNYENLIKLIAPGDPTSSVLLVHPLAPEAGGDRYHSGGRQFESQSDPDWQVLAEWVKQEKVPEYSNVKLIAPADLGRTMHNEFNVGLGQDCNFCHGRDFAADTNPMKAMARKMIQLTRDLSANGTRVACYTCHRGEAVPRLTPLSLMP